MDEEPLYGLYAHVFGEERYWGADSLGWATNKQQQLASAFELPITAITIVRAN